MRFLVLAVLTSSFAVMSLAQAHGQDQTGSNMIGGSFTVGSVNMVQGEYQAPGPGCCDPRNDYRASLTRLKWEIDRQTRKDGGRLTAAHEAKLQQELDDINRRFHQGPFARVQARSPNG